MDGNGMKTKKNKSYAGVFHKATDELFHLLPMDGEAEVEYDNSKYYVRQAATFEDLMSGRKKSNPKKGPDWKKEWDE